MKKQMRIATSNFLQNVVSGIGWIGYGIVNLSEHPVCRVLAVIFMSIVCIAIAWPYFAQREQEDEMSTHNMQRAKAKSLDILIFGFCVLSILCTKPSFLNRLILPFHTLFPFLVGVASFLIGFLFLRYEKGE